MSGANEERGETSITLEGVEYPLRPSFAAIQAIEKKLGRSLTETASAMSEMSLSIAQMGIVAAELMQAWGRANPEHEVARVAAQVNADRVAELIFEEGVPKCAIRLTLALMAAATGGVTASGEVKPAVGKGGSTTAG